MEPSGQDTALDQGPGSGVMGLQASMRAAAYQLLSDYIADAHLKVTVYDARPKIVQPGHAFVDAVTERIVYDGVRRRMPVLEAIVVHRIFDGREAAMQKDAFVDGFLDWCLTRPHAAGANSVVQIAAVEDVPNWAPDWYQTSDVFYASRIVMEGFGG